MADNTDLPQPIFPDMPRGSPVISKDGGFESSWNLGLSSLFQALQTNYSNEGLILPPITTDQANIITSKYLPYIGNPLPPGVQDISGKVIYNPTIELPQIFIISFDGATPPNVTGVGWFTFTIT